VRRLTGIAVAVAYRAGIGIAAGREAVEQQREERDQRDRRHDRHGGAPAGRLLERRSRRPIGNGRVWLRIVGIIGIVGIVYGHDVVSIRERQRLTGTMRWRNLVGSAQGCAAADCVERQKRLLGGRSAIVLAHGVLDYLIRHPRRLFAAGRAAREVPAESLLFGLRKSSSAEPWQERRVDGRVSGT